MTYKAKGQLKCFQCKQSYPLKEGDWCHWNQMQVFLCKRCDSATQGRPERPKAEAAPSPKK